MPDLIIQAGPESFKFSRDPRLGVVAATLKCWAPDEQTALFGKPPAIAFDIPEWNPRQCNRRDAGDQSGYDVVISFEGHPQPDAADGESFEMEGSTSEDAIETHWNLQVLKNVYGGKRDASGHVKWPDTLPGHADSRNPMYGVVSWLNPGLIWNHNWLSRILPESIVYNIGTITAEPPGNPPALSGNRNWICIRSRARQRGNIWQVQTSYQLSDRFGFVPEMYPAS